MIYKGNPDREDELNVENIGSNSSKAAYYRELYNDLFENIKNTDQVITGSDLQSKLNIDAFTELETLKSIKAMNLPDTIDYVTSSWCFRHLVDPAGTLIQTHNLLTPGTGIFHGDGFFLALNHKDLPDPESYLTMPTLLHNLNVPYIYDPQDNVSHRAGGFIISRVSEQPIKTNFRYRTVDSGKEPWEYKTIYSGKMIIVDAGEDWEVPDANYSYRASPYRDNSIMLDESNFIERFNVNISYARKCLH